jgi:CRP/FNR family transcriptional regulator
MNDKSLKQIKLFQSLTDEEMEQIIQKMIVKQFKKNETILYEEDTNRFMYIIISGKAKAVRTTEEGKEIILAMHKSGSFFGEMSLIDGKTVPASVIATEDALIAILAKKDFFSIVFLHKKVARNLLTILSTRLRRCWDTIQLLNFNHASSRTKMLLLMLTEEYGEKKPEGTVLNIKLTHQDISNMTGLTRETVTRVIDKLQKQKEIIVLKNKSICLTPRFMKNDINIPAC